VAARQLFREHGYRGTTVRAIGAAAGVDAALVNYHFGSKQALFGQSLNLFCIESSALDDALRGDQAGLADRLLVAVTRLWDETAATGEAELVVQDADTMAALREYLEHELRVRIAGTLRGQDASQRAAAAVGVLGGLIFTRYLNPVASIAALSPYDVQRVFGPALRAALHAPRMAGAQRPRVAPRGRPPGRTVGAELS